VVHGVAVPADGAAPAKRAAGVDDLGHETQETDKKKTCSGLSVSNRNGPSGTF